MLEMQAVQSGYGPSQVLFGVDLRIEAGQVVTLLGRNGMGKTTLLKSLIGLLPARGGSIRLNGTELTRLPSHQRVAQGLAFVPQGRMVFPHLTVEQNILSGAARSGHRTVPDYLYRFFPVLQDMKQRKAGNLSGGQQQMLAIARALMCEPRMLLLDEPSMGLAPLLVKEIFGVIARLKSRGIPILLVEQNAHAALSVADRGYVLETGAIALGGPAAQLLGDERVKAAYLGL